jgi:hypothetical protein
VRPGYTATELGALLGPSFTLDRTITYSRAFSELVDTALNGLYVRMEKKKGPASRKGTVVTQNDMRKHRKQFLLLSTLYPVLWLVAKLDALLWFQPGYKLIVQARRRPA